MDLLYLILAVVLPFIIVYILFKKEINPHGKVLKKYKNVMAYCHCQPCKEEWDAYDLSKIDEGVIGIEFFAPFFIMEDYFIVSIEEIWIYEDNYVFLGGNYDIKGY